VKGWSNLSIEKPCSYDNKVFPHEMEVCDNGKCMICMDGVFEDYQDPSAPKYGLQVSVGPT